MYRYARRFDGYYPKIKADTLKRMVQLFGQKYTMRKQECIDFLPKAMADPAMVKRAISFLKPFELLSLVLAKQMGGAIDYKSLAIALFASGCEIPSRLLKHREPAVEIADHLIKRGLFLNDGRRPGDFYVYGYEQEKLFTDPRLLDYVSTPMLLNMPLDATEPPATTAVRMPPTIVLEIISILQTVENMGGLGITKQGALRVNDVRKFQKAMQWPKGDLTVDGLVFRNTSDALLGALRYSDFLQLTASGLKLKKSIEEVAALSYVEQVSALVNGFMYLSEWNELAERYWQYTHYRDFRSALLIALTSLPLDSDDFYMLDEFDQSFYQRIGTHFALGGTARRYLSTYNKTNAQIKKMEAEEEAKRRQNWLEKERPWLTEAFSSWLYYLGMVELGLEAGEVVSFRLTPLGKAVLHPDRDFSISQTAGDEASEQAGAWIVQPNFDVTVYLDQTTPPQLAFLERHAERTQSQQYTAQYRLTRDSIYRGLESGTTLTELIELLERHAQAPLPQNVTTEIQEWAGLRDQVVLHRNANLIEYPTATARKKALQDGIIGTTVGDRFLLVTPAIAQKAQLAVPTPRINYSQPLKSILNINEDGQITLTEKPTDLWTEAQLSQWAEKKRGLRWQLTSDSVAARIKTGAKINDLLSFLNERSIKQLLPPFLEMALRNWAGKAQDIHHLKSVVMLSSEDPAVLRAVQHSERLEPYYWGRIDEEVLMFDLEHFKEVKDALLWAGLEI